MGLKGCVRRYDEYKGGGRGGGVWCNGVKKKCVGNVKT